MADDKTIEFQAELTKLAIETKNKEALRLLFLTGLQRRIYKLTVLLVCAFVVKINALENTTETIAFFAIAALCIGHDDYMINVIGRSLAGK